MDSTLKEILINHRVDGIFHSHVSMINPKGKFQFNKKQLEDFWNLYLPIVNENPNMISGIAEKPQHILPVLVDVDLKILSTDNTDENFLYTRDELQKVIQVYQSVLRNIIEDCNDNHLVCIVLEKDPYWIDVGEQSYMKHGFHLHFPYCLLNKVDQEIHLISRVKQIINEMKLFERLGYENSGDVIDKSCCTNAWLLYGSRKSEDRDPYLFSEIYDSNTLKSSLEKLMSDYQIFDYKDKLLNIRGNIEYYLPRILSIIPTNRENCEIKSGITSPLLEKLRKEKTASSFRKVSVVESLRIAKKIVPMIAPWRAEDRNEWMNIGWILFNIGEGCPEALDIWLDFSSQCEDKYDESTCIYNWDRMVEKDLTLGTLRYYAKTDSPVEYNRFKSEEANCQLQESLNGSHYNISKIMFAEYGDEFICASITNKIWFQFINHHWEQIEEGIFLRKKISNEIVSKFSKEGCKMFQQLSEIERGSAEETLYNARLKQAHKMVNNLNSNNYKNSIMKESAEVFYDHRFKDKLDQDPYLICFKNGVYDLKLNSFRPGRPEDFISKTLPINYKTFEADDENVLEVYKFLEQVFPDKSIRQYFMITSSEIFVGGNSRKVVLFWTGEGDNGKTVTQSFFEKMFGKLAIKFNTTVITGKKVGNGAANADLARAGGGVRLAVLEEPNGDESINNGIFKNLSGNDSILARDLFEKGKDTKEIEPMFKMIFICNKLPRFNENEKATWNRVRVLPFEATFCRQDDPAPDTYEEQLRQKRFPMDTNFSKKIPILVEAFAWILLEHRKKNIPYSEPEKVLAATEMYKKQNDIYRQFNEECIIEDINKYLSLIELYSQFKDWFKDSLPHHTIPVKKEVEEYYCKIWGEPDKGKKWKGYRIRTMQDQLDCGDIIVLEDDDLVDYNNCNKSLPPI